MAATARVLLRSGLVKVSDYSCDTPRSGCGPERCDPVASITIVRRGVHAHHARRQVALAEAGLALLYRGHEPYRLSHPYEREAPDRSTCLEFATGLLEEAFGTRRLARDLGTHLSPATQVLHLRAMAALGRSGSDRLASEETALGLVRAVAGDFDLSREDAAGAPAAVQRRLQRARAFIAAQPEADHGLAAVAAAAACSPFHLARLFKRHTGMTVRGYRLRLRLAAALHELADGATDLTELALRTGFADHSHMTASFRKLFKSTPSALRAELGGRGLAAKSKFLQATAGKRI